MLKINAERKVKFEILRAWPESLDTHRLSICQHSDSISASISKGYPGTLSLQTLKEVNVFELVPAFFIKEKGWAGSIKSAREIALMKPEKKERVERQFQVCPFWVDVGEMDGYGTTYNFHWIALVDGLEVTFALPLPEHMAMIGHLRVERFDRRDTRVKVDHFTLRPNAKHLQLEGWWAEAEVQNIASGGIQYSMNRKVFWYMGVPGDPGTLDMLVDALSRE